MNDKRIGFDSVSIDKEAVATRLGDQFAEAEIVDGAPRMRLRKESRSHLHVSKKVGESMHRCASLNPEYICCNTRVLRFLSNCPFDCSYCFLQSYLTNGATIAVADVPALMEEVRRKISAEPKRFFRIGTWELADSLALEQRLGTASELIESFSEIGNAVLEHRTKSDDIGPILGLKHRGRTIVSWSLNPSEVIEKEERGTAGLEQRLAAMTQIVSAGYLTAVHFDPMIMYEGWEEGYEELAEAVFSAVPAERIAWISIGALRFNPEIKDRIERDFPDTRITASEMILGPDGKVRYAKPLRLAMFRRLYDAILKYCGKDPLVYLCMERPDVWERILGSSPRSIGHLDYLFAKSLFDRFPGLVRQQPALELYERASTGR